jgi:prepilin-type N-terminal cleavage/methylation domain-containing protein/prepilin-type processing-associated H-X9-DG protein
MIFSKDLRTISRHGLTMIELLVVMAIASLLLGLLISGIQKAKEAANLAQCASNLKQIGLAFQMHHTAFSYYPTAGDRWSTPPTYRNGSPVIGQDQGAGWGFQILPFLGAEHVWRGGDETTDNGRQRFVVGSINPVFFCPSRREAMTVSYFDRYISNNSDDEVTHALCDYASNNLDDGTGAIRASHFGPPLRMSDITDGTSTTLLVGEKRLNLNFGARQRWDDNEGYSAGNDWDTMRDANYPPAPDILAPKTVVGFMEFGSSHSRGLNVVFADGSVRFICFAIDTAVFAQIGNRADGLPFSLDEF